MPENIRCVTVRSFGGFAGPAANRSVTVHSADLSAEEAGQLEHLVVRGVSELRQHDPVEPRPDQAVLEVVVSSETADTQAAYNESELPPSIRGLVDWIVDHTKGN